jgi:hypothetical protein
MNSDVAAAGASASASAPGKSPALADKQQQEKTEATTRMEKHRRDFTAGFLSEPAKPHATGSTSRRAGIVIIREIEAYRIPGLVIPWP